MIKSIISRPEVIWFIFGLVLFFLELLVPGFVIFFFGVGAWVTAILCLVANPGINLQFIVFGVTSVLSLLALRKILQKKFFYSEDNLSERVEDEFTGREALALTDISPDKKGKVEFKGTTWQAESESTISEGQTVVVSGKENVTLIVKPKI